MFPNPAALDARNSDSIPRNRRRSACKPMIAELQHHSLTCRSCGRVCKVGVEFWSAQGESPVYAEECATVKSMECKGVVPVKRMRL